MKGQGTKLSLILLVFLLFLSSAIGVLEINVISGLKITLNSQVLNESPIFSRKLLLSREFALFVFVGIVLTACLPVLDHIRGSLLVFVLMTFPIMLNYYTPTSHPLLPMEYTLMMILMLYIINVMLSYFMEVHTRERLIDTMGHYIPPQIVDRINRNEETISLDGEARTLSVMFCDIQDFSSIAEQLNPRQVAKLLNEYFTELSKILYKYHGTIDKFIGDGLMAFWGAPIKMDDHAQKSILAAMEMHERINTMSTEFSQRGWPHLNAGFGINTGLVSVGNMGSEFRLAYTVIGDTVNIAARIEKLTRVYKVPIIVNEPTMLECDDIVFREIDRVILKGRKTPSRIYQPLARREDADDHLIRNVQRHAEGLLAYYNQSHDRSLAIYRELLKEDPGDQYYAHMIEKAEKLSVS